MMMNVLNTPIQSQVIKPVSFGVNDNKKTPATYIDNVTASRASTGAFIGNILGGSFVGIPLFKAIVSKAIDNGAKKANPLMLLLATVAAVMGTIIPGYLGAKFLANRNKPKEQQLSSETLLKLTGASYVGTLAGSALGGAIASKMNGGVLPMLTDALITIGGNDTAVNLMAKQHNKDAVKPTVHYISTDQGPVVIQDFRKFLTDTKNSKFLTATQNIKN